MLSPQGRLSWRKLKMNKLSNWTILGYTVGVIWSVGFFIRYFIIWEDISQGILFVSLGLGIMGLAWLYNQVSAQAKLLEDLEVYMIDKEKEDA